MSPLEDVLREAAARGDREGVEAVRDAVAGERVLAPAVDTPEGAKAPAGIQDADGAWTFLAFTDLDAARAWRDDWPEWVDIAGVQLARFALSAGGQRLAINLSGPHGGVLERGDLELLAGAGARAPEVGPLTVPARPPTPDVLEVLRSAVAALDGLAAIVVLDAPESELGSHPVLGLVLAAGADPAAVARAAGPYAQRTVASGEAVDVVVLAPEDAARAEALGAPRVD